MELINYCPRYIDYLIYLNNFTLENTNVYKLMYINKLLLCSLE